MVISDELKYVYVDIPKTGSRSLVRVLENQFAGKATPRNHQPVFRHPEKWEDYFKFCVVRHPYDRLCSLWWATCCRVERNHVYQYLQEMKENTFYEFIQAYYNRTKTIDPNTYFFKQGNLWSCHAVPQNVYLECIDYDRVLRFETLQEEFNSLPFVNEYIELPVVNATTAKNKYTNTKLRPATKEIITQQEKDLIYDLFTEEFEILGYDKDVY